MKKDSKLKIVFVTDGDPVNASVLTEVAKVIAPSHVCKIDWSNLSSKAKKKNWAKFLSLSTYLRPIDRIVIKMVERQRTEEIASRLSAGQEDSNASNSTTGSDPLQGQWTYSVVDATIFNKKKNVAHLKSLSPDLIIVCGGPILRKSVFSIPRLGTINLHFGISSAYRGQHTIFWPLKFGDYENIGATIHLIDAGVDTGDVLYEVYPALSPEDGEVSIEIKVAQLLGRTLVELLTELKQAAANSVSGVAPESSQAREFVYRQRTALVQLGYWCSKWLLRRKPPTTQARVVKKMKAS